MTNLLPTLRAVVVGVTLVSYQNTTAVYLPENLPGEPQPAIRKGPRAGRLQLVDVQQSAFWNPGNLHYAAKVRLEIDYPSGGAAVSLHQQALADAAAIHAAIFDAANHGNPRTIACDAAVCEGTTVAPVSAPGGNSTNAIVRVTQTWTFHTRD